MSAWFPGVGVGDDDAVPVFTSYYRRFCLSKHAAGDNAETPGGQNMATIRKTVRKDGDI